MPTLRRRSTGGARRLRIPDARPFSVQLGAGRSVIAAAILAAPVPAARLLGADTATAQRVTWLTRMLGIRDGVVGVGTLDSVRRHTDTGPWLLGGAVADAVDAAVIASALKQGRMRGIVPMGIVAGASASAVLHVITAARLRRR